MVKGTPSFGKHHKTRVIRCRRCGRRSYHIRHKACSACGFGKKATLRRYSWQTKKIGRKRRLI
ncbi:MAG: 50S ribosomal protein L37e [Candidatus Sifarchaeia archaeon]